MADELSVRASVRFSKGGAKARMVRSALLDVAGDSYVEGTQIIGDTEEEIAQLADLGAPGYVMIENLDSSYEIYVGTITEQYHIKLIGGDICLFRSKNNSVFAKAESGQTVLINYLIIEV